MSEIQIKTAKFNRSAKFTSKNPNKLSTFLPYLLFVSFMWCNVYNVLSGYTAETIIQKNIFIIVLFDLAFYAAIDFALFWLLLWVYKQYLQTKIYFFLVSPKNFEAKLKFWMIVKNLILGALYFILFSCPYLSSYFPVINLVLSFLVVFLTYISLNAEIGVLFKHLFYKMVITPWFVYQICLIVLSLLLGGL